MEDINFTYESEDNSFIFSHTKISGHANMPSNHFHSEYEIYYLISGERHHFISDRTYYIKPGDIVFINTFDLHRTSDVGIPNHERMLIRFKKDFLKSDFDIQNMLLYLFDNNRNVIRLPAKEQAVIETLLFKILHETQSKQNGYKIQVQAILLQLLVFCSRYLEQNICDTYEHPSEAHKRVSEIAQYINTNYAEQLTLASLSEKFFISPFYLTRIFKAFTGFTIIEYINNIRIKEAQKLLVSSNWKMTKISETCGFGSVSHFGRMFKAITGFSPLSYRNMNKS